MKTITTQVDSFYKKTKDSILLAKYYHFKALQNKLTYTNDSSFYYYHLSKDISKKINDSLAVGRRLLSLAILQREAKDYRGGEISLIEALQYLEPIQTSIYLERVYTNLGLISEELDQKDDAIQYYAKTLNINKRTKDKRSYTFTNNNLGLLYQKRNNHKKAISYFNKGLSQDSIKEKYPTQYALLLENLAASNFLLGKKENVLRQYNKVLRIREREKDFTELSTTHINLADYYKNLNQTKKALFHSNEALQYAKQTHNNKRWLEALKNLSDLTSGEQSKQYLKEYIALNDSLFQNERRLKNQFAKIRYETDKKEKENTVLKTENEKKQAEILQHKQQKTIGWLLFVLSLLLFGVGVLFYFNRKRKLLYQAQLERIQAREHERKQIAKSLHDEVAGDLRLLHRKLEKSNLLEEAQKLDAVKENVRNLSHQLSSVSFDKVPFKDQIINLVSDYFELDFKIKVYGIRDYDWTTLDNSIKRLLYLSTRESIQNCKKHAKASKITINFSVRKKYVHLGIIDNGIGFNTTVNKKGIGLQNLQERIEELNGKLTISSEVGKGTQTSIQIPLNGWTNKNTFS
ncbi:tetratricopeptide repeat protein [Tenacibaculum sp. Mcav3-52]|uniref:tetratricopeptide repeat-containing sensor histidine kinase n=1 Tax=Tenacibaculum sp. Mcav3-52 TaxID=2917762 RepID=UPI0012E6384D|nr:tetratricopeptide repeat-containing sensor histidine kinase [Tenacibaculum sp. Mcav3-52]MCG7500712.1 tetratricopeptide repeat protein [Tenacibaculum sp. Mcav3-52]GFD78682.1 two-component sensor histidine kinase [Tenacibaculum sp. KUL118]